jgi:hypothetical protein
MLAALEWLKDHAPTGTLNAQAYSQAQFPEEDPHWDPNEGVPARDWNDVRRHYWEA